MWVFGSSRTYGTIQFLARADNQLLRLYLNLGLPFLCAPLLLAGKSNDRDERVHSYFSQTIRSLHEWFLCTRCWTEAVYPRCCERKEASRFPIGGGNGCPTSDLQRPCDIDSPVTHVTLDCLQLCLTMRHCHVIIIASNSSRTCPFHTDNASGTMVQNYYPYMTPGLWPSPRMFTILVNVGSFYCAVWLFGILEIYFRAWGMNVSAPTYPTEWLSGLSGTACSRFVSRYPSQRLHPQEHGGSNSNLGYNRKGGWMSVWLSKKSFLKEIGVDRFVSTLKPVAVE